MPQRSGWSEAAFKDFLRAHSNAEEAIEKLAPEDQRNRLIPFLRGVVSPGSKKTWEHAILEWVPRPKRAQQVAKMLEKASYEFGKLACGPFGVVFLGALERDPTPGQLVDAMQRQADSLSRWATSPQARLGRLVSFRRLWKHVFLVLAVEFIKQCRQGPIPWGDLAYALEAILAGYGVERDISPDALRKQYSTFIRSKAGKAFSESGLKDWLLSLSLSFSLY